jgi:hypothetical protein
LSKKQISGKKRLAVVRSATNNKEARMRYIIVMVFGSGLGDPAPIEKAIWGVDSRRTGIRRLFTPVHVIPTAECRETISVLVISYSSGPEPAGFEKEVHQALQDVFPNRPIDVATLPATRFLNWAAHELNKGTSG